MTDNRALCRSSASIGPIGSFHQDRTFAGAQSNVCLCGRERPPQGRPNSGRSEALSRSRKRTLVHLVGPRASMNRKLSNSRNQGQPKALMHRAPTLRREADRYPLTWFPALHVLPAFHCADCTTVTSGSPNTVVARSSTSRCPRAARTAWFASKQASITGAPGACVELAGRWPVIVGDLCWIWRLAPVARFRRRRLRDPGGEGEDASTALCVSVKTGIRDHR